MAIGRDGAVLRQLRTLFDAGTVVGLTDGQLLERFATRPPEAAEAAFGVLVERHGPMVLRVCRGVLADPNDAQDAFQATFLVLVRKARDLWVRDSLGPWLHQVAHRTACCARSDAARRRRHERRAAERGAASRDGDGIERVHEWERALHEEIARLPERYRAAVVLCDLEGCPHEQAARHLGCPVGTVKSRLARGRGRLRDRLSRRGLAPAVGASASMNLSAEAASPSMAFMSRDPTVQAMLHIVAGRTAGAVRLPARVVTLTSEVLRTMMMTKLKMTAMIALSVGVLSTGVAVVAQPGAQVKKGANEKSPRVSPVRSEPDSRDRVIRNRLEQPSDLKLPEEVSLGKFLAAIRAASQEADDTGIPIYVEPAGLKEAGKTADSPVNVTRNKVPLRMTLKSVLRQLNLSYEVRDGLLRIDSKTALLENRLEEVERKLDRILKALEGAKRDEGQ